MGFASASILISINGDAPVAQWRQDCTVGSVVTVKLSDNVGANTYRWRLIGRPEGSTTAGPGPEPLQLGTATSASFAIDIKGTYVVECLVNGGAPDADIIVGGVAYLESFLSPGNLPLRLLGPGETSEDNADPQVAQGWIKMLNRWLRKVAAGGGAGDSYKVMNDENDPSPDYLFYKVESLDGSVTITNDTTNRRSNFAVASKPTPVLTKRYYLTDIPSDLQDISPRPFLFSLNQPAPADLQPVGGSTFGIIMDSPLGDPSLVTWPSGIVLAHIVARVVNAHDGITYPMSFGTGDTQGAILTRGPSQFVYQSAPWPAKPLLTADYQTLIIPLFVQQLTGSTDDRLRAWFKCNAQGGPVTDEIFEIHLGDSYLDTLFPPSDGSTGSGDTYKVKTDSPDTEPGYLDAKLIDESGNPFPVVPNGGIRKVQLHDRLVASGATDTTPSELINKVESLDGSLVISEDTARRRVNFQTAPAASVGGKLWPSYVKDLLQKAAVDAIYGGYLQDNFTQVGTGIWRRNVPGGIVPQAFDSITPYVGMRVLDAIDGVAAGIYDVLDTGDSVVAENTPYYIQADGSLGLTAPATSGELTATVASGYAAIKMESAAIGLTSWPGGTVPVTVRAWVTGGAGSYTFGFADREAIELDRGYIGGGGTVYEYTGEPLPTVQAITSTPQMFTFNVPVDAAASTEVTDWLVLNLQAWGADGATLHIGYGGPQPSAVTTLFTTTTLHYAILQRSADADATADFSDGMYCLVNGGTLHAGQTWQATLPTPFELDVDSQTWASVSPPTLQPTYELLTAAELGLADSVPHVAGASAASGEVEILVWTSRDSFAGVTLAAADTWRAHIPVNIGGDTAAPGNIVSFYIKGSLDSVWHLVGQTDGLHNPDTGVFDAVGSTGSHGGADYLMSAGEYLQYRLTILTDSADGITVAVVHNRIDHYIETPLTIGFAGTDYHPDLSGRALPDQHPQRAISTIETPPYSLVDGNLTPNPTADTILFDEEATISRIDASQWPNGTAELTFHFATAGHLINKAGNSGSLIELRLGNSGGLSDTDAAQWDGGADSVVCLRLSQGAKWILCWDNTGTTTFEGIDPPSSPGGISGGSAMLTGSVTDLDGGGADSNYGGTNPVDGGTA